jgi:Cof subfamily protein (haloacid dehalogenase superfamily)
MKGVSLVVTDVDGTLVTTGKTLTPRAIAAVERLHDAGIAFSICSSRPPFGLRMLVEPLGLRLPFGGYNAGAIVNPDDFAIVEQKLVAPDAAREAVETFRAQGIDCWVFDDARWLVANPQGSHVAHETRTVETPPTVVPGFTAAHFAAVGKIVGPSDDHALVARLAEQLRARLDGRANVARSQLYYCDVTAPGVDKGRLIDLLAARLGLPQDEILVLGDGDNDVQMFARAGFGVAMGNASDAVKAAAQATTLSNDEDGFAAAIERYVFGG